MDGGKNDLSIYLSSFWAETVFNFSFTVHLHSKTHFPKLPPRPHHRRWTLDLCLHARLLIPKINSCAHLCPSNTTLTPTAGGILLEKKKKAPSRWNISLTSPPRTFFPLYVLILFFPPSPRPQHGPQAQTAQSSQDLLILQSELRKQRYQRAFPLSKQVSCFVRLRGRLISGGHTSAAAFWRTEKL